MRLENDHRMRLQASIEVQTVFHTYFHSVISLLTPGVLPATNAETMGATLALQVRPGA
jgi:hypothetical protein